MAQPRLDLPHLYIDPAQPLRHSPLGFPPVCALKPADAVGSDSPLPATPDDSCGMTIGAQAYQYVFHRPKLQRGWDKQRNAKNPAILAK